MDTKSLISANSQDLALVIGNGINRYGAAPATNSWHQLLVKLAGRHLPTRLQSVPAGISLTEFYDVLDLKSPKDEKSTTLQREFCESIKDWRPYDQHERIVQWAKRKRAPILTTNFENALSDAGRCSLFRAKRRGFTDHYPWEVYFGDAQIDDPANDFGIWHVNGMQQYYRSIRLGLTHYMGSVERARGWFHKGDESRLFAGKNEHKWIGARSWLHIVFNCSLLIFGVALEENEVFLRWLLIERARYFKSFPHRRKQGWYVYAGAHNNDGKQFFLEGVGITPIHVSSYDKIYGASVWRSV